MKDCISDRLQMQLDMNGGLCTMWTVSGMGMGLRQSGVYFSKNRRIDIKYSGNCLVIIREIVNSS